MFDEVGKFDYINIICKCFKNIHVSISQPLLKSIKKGAVKKVQSKNA